jgi:hypothetical protein
MHLAGVILDIYDDANASILVTKLAGAELPPSLQNMELMDPADLGRLPDRMFALVAQNAGDTVRKYAMHDAGHLTTSITYFMERSHLLPEQARKTAARNLVGACEWYDIEPPAELSKMAGITSILDAAGHLGNAQSRMASGQQAAKSTMDGFRAAQAGFTSDMQKKADLTGTEMMPAGGSLTQWPHPRNTAKPTAGSAGMKRASWEHCGDLTQHRPVEKVAMAVTRYAMPSQERYPLDSYEHVKQASAYFDEHYAKFDLDDRREYAVNLASRLEELGLPVEGATQKYAGHEYGPFVDVELAARVRNYEGTGHEHAYQVLLEKKASVPPSVMVDMLAELDAHSGAYAYYNRSLGFRDPFQATFGKFAKDEKWSWSEGNDYVNDDMLKNLADKQWMSVQRAFGEDMRKSFQKDPVGVFSSMPDPQKVVLARLAGDSEQG